MTDQTTTAAAGLEDVVRSVRVLARQARELVERGLGTEGVAMPRPGLPYREVTVDGRSAILIQVGKVELTVFTDDGEVRVLPRRKR